jgi:hypothetical protein
LEADCPNSEKLFWSQRDGSLENMLFQDQGHAQSSRHS